MYHPTLRHRLFNRLHAGRRVGRVTIWTASRGARFKFEKFGVPVTAVSIAIRPFPDRHSELNLDLYIRLR